MYSGFSHQKWWFSIATLNYQRVDPRNLWNPGTLEIDPKNRRNYPVKVSSQHVWNTILVLRAVKPELSESLGVPWKLAPLQGSPIFSHSITIESPFKWRAWNHRWVPTFWGVNSPWNSAEWDSPELAQDGILGPRQMEVVHRTGTRYHGNSFFFFGNKGTLDRWDI